MDFLALGFILYFLFVKFGQHLNAVGLAIKGSLRSIFLGLLGYMAFLPVLIAAAFISYFIGGIYSIVLFTRISSGIFKLNPTYDIYHDMTFIISIHLLK